MKNFAMILAVLGVCVGALGASGFHRPDDAELKDATRENYALFFFLVGATSLAAGGVMVRQSRRSSSDPEAVHEERAGYVEALEKIQTIVGELDRNAADMPGEGVRDRIGELMADELFDLTSKSDDLALLIGFDAYAKVWEGVATGERLLNRCWSMCTDGHVSEGIEEIPLAKKAFDQAAAAMRAIA